MIDFLSNNVYALTGGFIVAFIASYLIVQGVHNTYEYADVNPRKLRNFGRILGVIPFLILIIVVMFLGSRG